MKVSELIEVLSKYPKSSEVCINYRISRDNHYEENWKHMYAHSQLRRIDAEKISIQSVGQDDLGYVCGLPCIQVYEDSKWNKDNGIVEAVPEGNWTNTAEVVFIDMIDTPTQLDHNGTR